MPEQITEYPEVTLSVLKGAGAGCGEGVPRKILTQCPGERFCSLPTGEICVYGIDEIPRMNQITTQEPARVVCPPRSEALPGTGSSAAADALVLGAVFAAGPVVGGWRGLRGRRRQ
jgi:hypothetical protein